MIGGLRGRAQSRGASSMPRYVWLPREAVVVQPPQVIADANALWADWSPDGSHLVVFRTEPPFRPDVLQDTGRSESGDTTMSLLLWNGTTRRAFSVWKHDGTMQSGDRVTWLPGAQTGLLPVRWTEQTVVSNADGTQKPVVTEHRTLLFVDTARERVHEALLPPNAGLEISPVKPQVLLYDDDAGTARILDKDGVPGAALSIPKKSPNMSVDWMPDGGALRLTWREKTTDTPARTVRRRARFDLTTHDVALLDKAADKEDAAPAPIGVYTGALRVRQTVQVLHEGTTTHRVRPLWLEGSANGAQTQAIVCADGEQAHISPRGNAVAYLAQGVAWVTPLAYTPREAFTQALRAQTYRSAKQAMTAVLMYCQDYDETYPAASDHLGAAISPYLKNADIVDGLNYTYKGGPLADVESPATTIMGTFTGPGGTVVLYADGHVKWKTD